jgi:catechol 2,3-dioxygenase-like lactoylglutathione lyase family enzyme
MHHFGIATTRREEMVQWYRDVLGMEVVANPGQPVPFMTFVTNDNHHHRGGFFQTPNLVDDPDRLEQSRVQHMAWEYEDIDQMLESWERIKNLGIEPVACWCHYVSFSFYYKDPDRNTVELTCQGFDTIEKGVEYARTPEWEANPNGTSIDPAKLLQARKDGVGLDELRERSKAGDYKPQPEPPWTAAW